MFAWIALYVDWVLNLAKQKKPEIDRFRAFLWGYVTWAEVRTVSLNEERASQRR
ncbi:hypothetical protein [Spirosoma panaciterrae]|uniref:hypothetical protein n=1 Tax=Spirosoma panaciterrae TaxID=496058 RepID=UPI00037A351D|nr:hypothetical protein [Spirosoma panaciterrae]